MTNDELDRARQELIDAGLIRAKQIEHDVWEYTLLYPPTGEALFTLPPFVYASMIATAHEELVRRETGLLRVIG